MEEKPTRGWKVRMTKKSFMPYCRPNTVGLILFLLMSNCHLHLM